MKEPAHEHNDIPRDHGHKEYVKDCPKCESC